MGEWLHVEKDRGGLCIWRALGNVQNNSEAADDSATHATEIVIETQMTFLETK